MRSITKRFSQVNKELNARALGIQEETQANIKEVPSNDMEYNLRLIFIACITQLKVKVLLDPINKTEMAQFFGVTEGSITEAIETYHVQYKANIKYYNPVTKSQVYFKDQSDYWLQKLTGIYGIKSIKVISEEVSVIPEIAFRIFEKASNENQSVMLQMIKDFIDPELSHLSENEILEDRIVESSINE